MLRRNEFSNYQLYLNFTVHCSPMSEWAIIPKFTNIVPALILSKTNCERKTVYNLNKKGNNDKSLYELNLQHLEFGMIYLHKKFYYFV